jgi:hypothetical protein
VFIVFVAVIMFACEPKLDATRFKRAVVELRNVVGSDSVISLPSASVQNRVRTAISNARTEYDVYEKVLPAKVKEIYPRIEALSIELAASIYTGWHGDDEELDAQMHKQMAHCRAVVAKVKPLLDELVRQL